MIRLRSLLLASLTLASAACNTPQEPAPAVPPVESNMRTLPVESITITGILVDTWCYSQEPDAAADGFARPHVDTACAAKSMKLGYPVAVVTDSDVVWVLSETPRLFAKFLNDSVRVSGDIRSEGILIPRSFDRHREEAWENIF